MDESQQKVKETEGEEGGWKQKEEDEDKEEEEIPGIHCG